MSCLSLAFSNFYRSVTNHLKDGPCIKSIPNFCLLYCFHNFICSLCTLILTRSLVFLSEIPHPGSGLITSSFASILVSLSASSFSDISSSQESILKTSGNIHSQKKEKNPRQVQTLSHKVQVPSEMNDCHNRFFFRTLL